MKTYIVNGVSLCAVSEKITVNSHPGYSVSYNDITNVEEKLTIFQKTLFRCFKITNYR